MHQRDAQHRSPHRLYQLTLALATSMFALFAQSAPAAYPDRPITLIAPYPAGGATDIVSRILQKGMTQRLGVPVIVENKAGAGTAIGATALAQAAPDGYTVLVSSNTTFTINPALRSKLGYDPIKSFESIGSFATSPLVILAHPTLPANNIKELVALAKAQPGKLSYGSFGAGTTSHLAGEIFKLVAGVNIVHVPYKGSAPAMQDLIGGQIQLEIDTNVAALPQLRAGKVKALAITSAQRSPSLPNIPTVAESGYPDFEVVPWLAMIAPRGLPAPVKAKLVKVLADTVADPETRDALTKAGLDVHYQPPSAYEERVNRELPLLRAYIHRAGIVAE